MTSSRKALAYPTSEHCPDIEKHTSCPTGYVAWHEWAEKMSKTHKQHKCRTCGFYSIWKPRKVTEARLG